MAATFDISRIFSEAYSTFCLNTLTQITVQGRVEPAIRSMFKPEKLRIPSAQSVRKWIFQSFLAGRGRQSDLLLIFGCQRSGTSMFAEAFRGDLNSKVFGERGLSNDGEIRLPALDVVQKRLQDNNAGLRVAKPLVESQQARQILDFFPEARAVWMFRHYVDVVRSAEKRFSAEAPYRNLRPIVNPSLPKDFAAENVSPETRALVRKHFSDSANPDSAQALYWYVRNIRYFEQALDRHDRVMLCSYENFVRAPVENMRRVYDFLGRPFPGAQIVAHISAPQRDQPIENLGLPAKLKDTCDALLDRLQQTECNQAAVADTEIRA
jgi:hypothetical protein